MVNQYICMIIDIEYAAIDSRLQNGKTLDEILENGGRLNFVLTFMDMSTIEGSGKPSSLRA